MIQTGESTAPLMTESPWPKVLWGLLIFSFLGTILLPSFRNEYYPGENLYALQARAFCHGRLGLSEKHYDTALVGGQYHLVNPPFPALVLLPFVAVLPQHTDKITSLAVALALTVVAGYALRRILLKLAVADRTIPWACLGLFGGTGFWFCLQMSHAMWFFAHIVGITALLLAIQETLYKGRGVVAGFLLGAAFLSRQMMLYSVLFFAVALWQRDVQARQDRRHAWLNLAGFAGVFGLAVGGYLWFNWVRFGNPLDPGYQLLAQRDYLAWRQAHLGLFHPLYIPVNLIHLFFQGPHIEFDPPGLLTHWHLNPFGTSLTFASPFLLLAFWGTWPEARVHRALWATIFLTMTHALMYHTNGWVQVNTYRYALDFVPLVLLLAARSAPRIPPGWFRALVIYAVALNALALFWIPFIGRAYEQYILKPGP